MGYDYEFYFIKDDLIDPNTAVIQNVDNFLFSIYFNYLDINENYINEERKKFLGELFRKIKEAIISERIDFGYKKIETDEKVKKILKEGEKKRELKLHNLILDVKSYYNDQHILDKLIEYYENKFFVKKMNFGELKLYLNLYCILVNELDKTKREKFDQIKKEMQPFIKILKEIFCEFHKNEIHKKRTFIFPLSPHNGYDSKDFYIINNKENMLKYDEEEEEYGFYYDVKEMKLSINNLSLFSKRYKKDKKDERKFRYYNIVLDYSLKNLDYFFQKIEKEEEYYL